MSRVDQALRAWEKKQGVSRLSERFELGKYTREQAAPSRVDEQLQEPPVAAPAPVVPTPVVPVASAVAPSPVSASPAPSLPRPPRPQAFSTRLGAGLESRLVTGASDSVPLEQYRRLAAVLHDVQLQQGLKSLMLTSALPAEGKTLTTINLALTLSESYGRRVLVVDADLRRPSVHRVLGISNESGLNEALHSGTEPFIRQLSPLMAVLTAGNPELAPLVGLTSTRMADLLDRLGEQFDWILFDTPPVGLLPDAQLLARLTRAVVFVIAAGVTPQSTVERAVAELGPECVIGTVLNRVEDRRIPASGYYARYGYDSQDREA